MDMLHKKKTHPEIDRRKSDKDRRKPGDQRFPGRLVGKKKGKERAGDRRKRDRRKD
jgi:hypothetical protein